MDSQPLDFLKWQLDYVQSQIKFADDKMNLLLGISVAELGLAATQAAKIVAVFENACCQQQIVTALLLAAFLLLLVIFFVQFANVVGPRVDPRKYIAGDYSSRIFWKDVAGTSFADFQRYSDEERFKDVYSQIYVNSKIANAKFQGVGLGYRLLVPTLLATAALVAVAEIWGGPFVA